MACCTLGSRPLVFVLFGVKPLAMEKARFTELLDTSLYDFRQQLLAAYTGAADSASTSPLDESGRGSVRAVDSGQMSHEQVGASNPIDPKP